MGYMAESTEQTYWKSVAVRFQQARRHSQGIAELSYSFLQYIRLCMTVGFSALPFVAHRGILCIIWKMFTVHITNAVQATSVVVRDCRDGTYDKGQAGLILGNPAKPCLSL